MLTYACLHAYIYMLTYTCLHMHAYIRIRMHTQKTMAIHHNAKYRAGMHQDVNDHLPVNSPKRHGRCEKSCHGYRSHVDISIAICEQKTRLGEALYNSHAWTKQDSLHRPLTSTYEVNKEAYMSPWSRKLVGGPQPWWY